MPVNINFDTLFPATLTGTMTIGVIDEDGTPNSVLELNREFKVEVDWHLLGPGADTIDGSWTVLCSVESLGAGYEGPIGSAVVGLMMVQPGSTPVDRIFHAEIKAVPSTIAGFAEGIYKVVTLITYKNMFGSPRPMAAFAEAPILTFYQPA